jgi:hypothetical protein
MYLRRVTPHLRRIAGWLDAAATRRRILVAGWLLFVIYAYPGYMSTDSVDQLLQARHGPIHDWYPPLMAYQWRWLDRIVSGPFLMLVVQSVTFLVGLAAILRHAMHARAAAIAAVAILLFPPVLTQMAVIWKDSQMAGFLLAGIAGLLSPSRRWRVFGCVMLFFATAQRYNAPAATLPIVVALFVWSEAHTRWKRYGIALATWLAITATAFGVNRLLTEKRTHAWHNSLALFDIAGTIRFTPGITPEQIREELAGVPLRPDVVLERNTFRAIYNPMGWYGLVFDTNAVFAPPGTEGQRAAVTRAWGTMVTEHPLGYFKHRWRVFKQALGFSIYPPQGGVWDGFTETAAQPAMINHVATHSRVQREWLDLMPELHETLLFEVWFYGVLALAFVPLCLRHRLSFALLTSGIGLELSLFVVAPSRDFRYSHWFIVARVATAVMVFAVRWRAGRARATPQDLAAG